ncbi:hypothetical protein E4U60_005332 [Claviceps pazoutovae]|uniref:Uncharacterized protein n=1 Tax=Claviceps pazoutovae TaxID=1649127 RepID=A0A9P7M7V0_9HYPO|nr:hypothetical protein E4U60_005332 [Claviceps pazoutovae]
MAIEFDDEVEDEDGTGPFADPALLSDPPANFMNMVPAGYDSFIAKILWAGLKPNARTLYSIAARSFEAFCAHHNRTPWPVCEDLLHQWILARATVRDSPTIPQQEKVDPATLVALCTRDAGSTRRSQRTMHPLLFDSNITKKICEGLVAVTYPKTHPAEQTLITKELLLRLLNPATSAEEEPLDTIHLNAAFTIAFDGFLRVAEFTHFAIEEATPELFDTLRLILKRLTMSLNRDYLQLYLPRNKDDEDDKGVTIIIAATGDLACPVRNAEMLLHAHPRAKRSEPLFELIGGGFEREYIVAALRRRLALTGEPVLEDTRVSFRRGAAHHAYDQRLNLEQVQALGRWSFNLGGRGRRPCTMDPVQYFELAKRFAKSHEDKTVRA